MDIHRCRFVPYPSRAINALAFSKPSSRSISGQDTSHKRPCPANQRLAIGRNDGDIEIWNPAGGAWVQETIFRGGKERSIEGLVWTQDLPGDEDDRVEEGGPDEADGGGGGRRGGVEGRLRLFSIGFSSSVTEWDLGRGIPARHANGNFGTIWCLAAQPRWRPDEDSRHEGRRDGGASNDNPRSDQYLAAGCEDGTIVLFSTEDDDLRYVRTIGKPPTKKPRVLGLTWKDRNTIVAGYSDSYIRIYDIRVRQTIRNMSLGRSENGGNETLVWTVKCLPDGTIVSGDSAGNIKIWDGNNYSLMQSIHAHQADILDITTNASGSLIVTCGADRRTTLYGRASWGKRARSGRWAQIMHRRFHECDVKALASFESQDMSILVSGGLDTVPIVMPLRGWQKEYHRSLSHLPRCPPVSSAPEARLFISWWHDQVNIWQIGERNGFPAASGVAAPRPETHSLLVQMIMKSEENMSAADISRDGKYLAIATASSVKVFWLRLRHSPSSTQPKIRARKVDMPPSLSHCGARNVAFSPDCRWLCALRLDNEILMLRLNDISDQSSSPSFNKQTIKLSRTVRSTSKEKRDTSLGQYPDMINNIAFSGNSRILAAGDLSGRISLWILQSPEAVVQRLANGVHKTNVSRSSRSSSSSLSREDSSEEQDVDEGESEEESEEDGEKTVVDGQRWCKNLASPTLPQLDGPLLVMSFRPTSTQGCETARDASRKDAWSNDEDRLVTVTGRHRVVEFHTRLGNLSDWSRRNPISYLPPQFRQIRERAMGCFWDVSSTHHRLWLYGSSWMFMIDMAQDLSLPNLAHTSTPTNAQAPYQSLNELKKRKREETEAKQLRNQESGAGGRAPLSESYIGIAGRLRKFTDPQQQDTRMIDLEEAPNPNSGGSVTNDGRESALAQVRRKKAGEDEQRLVKNLSNGLEHGTACRDYAATPRPTKSVTGREPGSYLSLMHRSILGVVSIDGAVSGEAFSEQIPEVVVVERPLHEMDLPPRFDGGQDWET